MTNLPHLSIPTRLRTRRSGRWPLVLALLVAGLIPHALGHAPSARASASSAKDPCATATRATPLAPLKDFPATGLPAGPATVHPEYDVLPAAPPWKHSHCGPLYAYVISGRITISDNQTGTLWVCVASGTPGTWHRILTAAQ